MSEREQTHPHLALTESIIGAAMAVHRTLGPGLDEKIYENALWLEFAAQAIHFSQQERYPVSYRGHIVGTLVTDLIVAGKVIVETKVVEHILDVHIAQTLSSLSITQLQIGLILNFKHLSLGFKRVANIYHNSNPCNPWFLQTSLPTTPIHP